MRSKNGSEWRKRLVDAAGIGAVLVPVLLWTHQLEAQGAQRACSRLVAEGRSLLAKLESSAARLAVAANAEECRERLKAFADAREPLERIHDDLVAMQCSVDQRLAPDERQRAGQSVTRWERRCEAFDTPPVERTPIVETTTRKPSEASRAGQRTAWLERIGAMAPASLMWAVFLSLLALVALSIAVGRMTSRSAPVRGSAPPADPPLPAPAAMPGRVSWGTGSLPLSPASVVHDVVSFMPVSGGTAFHVERRRLDNPGVTLGRDARLCDIVVRDNHVSSRHARIWRDHAGLHIQDLGSTNGVWREGKRVSVSKISEGETIRLGDTAFRLVSPSR